MCPSSTRRSRRVPADPHRRSATTGAARELAGELGGLPLALEQAAAYMQATGRSIAEYLALFRQRRADLLARGEPAGYGKQVATTWALAFDQLQQSRPGGDRAAAAAGVLRARADPAAACCSSPGPSSPRRSTRRWRRCWCRCWTILWRPDDAVAALRRYSLISARRTARCRCTGWCRPSPSTRCPPTRPRRGGRPPPRDRGRPARRHRSCRIPGPSFAALLPHAQAALAADSDGMDGSPATWATAATTRRRATSSSRSPMPASGCSAPSTPTP